MEYEQPIELWVQHRVNGLVPPGVLLSFNHNKPIEFSAHDPLRSSIEIGLAGSYRDFGTRMAWQHRVLLTVLHELGHVHMRHGPRNWREEEKVKHGEVEAWQWALAHTPWYLTRSARVYARWALDTYELEPAEIKHAIGGKNDGTVE